MAQQTPAKQLFELLVTKNFDPECLDSMGKPSANPAEAEIFSFDYTAESGNDYGTVVVMLADDNDLQVYFGDNLGKGMEAEDKKDWFDFLYALKHFATKNLLSFSLKNLNRLRYSMQGQAAIKEGIFESWSGTRTTSWNGRPTEARLMIKHKRPLGENDARFRYVESLFIETAEGERFKLPFTKLSGGRAMVEHIRQGGRVWDARGQHITEMVNELNVLSRFRRASHGKIFEGDTKDLVEQTNAYYETAQKTLKSMSHSRGYKTYFESWNPDVITEEEVTVEGLKHLFVTQSLDSRIEDALPLLARIQQQGNAMKEANIFEAWVNNLAEGTWAIPDTPEKQKQLVDLMSKEFTVGADATNATEQLYDLLGDDELFDQLEALAEENPDADCRQVVMDRMQMLSDEPDIQTVINNVQLSDQATMNPAEPTDAGMSAPQDQAQVPAEEPAPEEEGVPPVPTMEEVKDPETQTEDPANTQQPKYDEYQDSLLDILRVAGVPAKKTDAVDYEPEVKEGWKGAMAGGIAGGAAGSALGAAGGPIGSLIGSLGGSMAGSEIGDKVGDKIDQTLFPEKTDEGDVHSVPTYIGKLGAAAVKTGADDAVEIAKTLVGKDEETKESALQGQYGHSGKLKAVAEDTSFLDRLKELSGMIRN